MHQKDRKLRTTPQILLLQQYQFVNDLLKKRFLPCFDDCRVLGINEKDFD